MAEKFLYNLVKKHNITKAVFVGYCIAFSLIFYFAFITIFGEKGLIQYKKLKEQIENRESVKQELNHKVEVKKNMVDGMNTNSLDLDLLDEQARKTLGYIGKNEVVIYNEESNHNKN